MELAVNISTHCDGAFLASALDGHYPHGIILKKHIPLAERLIHPVTPRVPVDEFPSAVLSIILHRPKLMPVLGQQVKRTLSQSR